MITPLLNLGFINSKILSSGGGDITSGLVAWYPFNEGSGTTATDTINGNNAALQGTLGNSTWQTGSFFFFPFAAPYAYWQAPDAGQLDFNSAITIIYYFNSVLDNNGSGGPISILGKGYNSQFFSGGAGNNSDITFYSYINFSAAGITSTGGSFFDGNWHQVCITWDSADGIFKIYKDGVLNNSSSTPTFGSISTVAEPLVIGDDNQYDQGKCYGAIKHVRIYNRALSQSEISTVYAFLT